MSSLNSSLVETPSLLALPEEILTHIVSFLSFREVVSLSKANHYLQRLCDSDDVWKPRCLGYDLLHEVEAAEISNNRLLQCSAWKLVFRNTHKAVVFHPTERDFKNESQVIELDTRLFSTPKVATISLYFNTKEKLGGIILGQQSRCFKEAGWPHYHHQIVYIDAAGCIRAAFESPAHQHIVGDNVVDGEWHHLHLISNKEKQTLWLDGKLVGHLDSPWGGETYMQPYAQLGTGLLSGPQGAPLQLFANRNDWWPFHGAVRDFRLWLNQEVPVKEHRSNNNTTTRIPSKEKKRWNY